MKKTLALATACLLALAPSADPGKPLAPHESIQEFVRAVRHNDLRALIEVSAGPEELEKMRAQWENQRAMAPSERDRREFAKAIAFLTAEGAEDRIMELVRPKLNELRPQWDMASSMVIGMMQSGLEQDPNLDPTEKEQARKLVGALSQIVKTTDFTSEELAEKAVAVLCRTARRMGVRTIEDVQSLELEQLLQKGGMLEAGVKEVLKVYGIDANAFLDSVRAETVFESGEKAKVRVSYVLLGQRITAEGEMVKVDGRWTFKDMGAKAANVTNLVR